MKITKPRNLGLLHSTYTLDGNHQWVVKPVIFFDLTGEDKVLPEIESWRRVMNDLPAQQVFDEAQAKKSPEVLIAGNVYSPEGSTSTELQAGFRIGSLAKSLKSKGITNEIIGFREYIGAIFVISACFVDVSIWKKFNAYFSK